MKPTIRRLTGAFLLLLLGVHAILKAQTGLFPEVLWSCHLASGVLAIGLLLDWSVVSAVGFLFHVAIALPTYALHLLSRGDTNWTSMLLHVLSPLAGWFFWRGRALPSATPWLAWGFFIGTFMLSRVATPASLNVNLAFRPWEPWDFLGAGLSHTLNILLVLGQLHAVHWLLGRRRAIGIQKAEAVRG